MTIKFIQGRSPKVPVSSLDSSPRFLKKRDVLISAGRTVHEKTDKPKGEAFRDTPVFEYKESWWLYSLAGEGKGLKLYFADSPLGPWTEHPKSPVIHQNPDLVRSGGSVTIQGDWIIRYGQDSYPYYGNQVWAIEVTLLTKEDYTEHPIGDRPILKGYENWNTRGMHHLCPIQLSDRRWIAAVDGHGRQMNELTTAFGFVNKYLIKKEVS